MTMLHRLARELGVGQTYDRGNIRVKRLPYSVHVWDLTNAGVRGKPVDHLVIGWKPDRYSDERGAILSDALATCDDMREAEAMAKIVTNSSQFQMRGGELYFDRVKDRGADVPPKLRGVVKHAGYLNVGDLVWMGKYKNKLGKILAFGVDAKGNPTITITPIPKGRKQDKTFSLFKVWRVRPEQIADLKARGKIASMSDRVKLRHVASEAGWEQIGVCGVDTGSLVLIDPCYIKYWNTGKHPELGDASAAATSGLQLHFDNGIPACVVTPTGHGDGSYPVFVRRDEGGRIIGLLAYFDHYAP